MAVNVVLKNSSKMLRQQAQFSSSFHLVVKEKLLSSDVFLKRPIISKLSPEGHKTINYFRPLGRTSQLLELENVFHPLVFQIKSIP